MTQIYLTMPQPGETITEGSVVTWMLPVGSQVAEGQAVVELETEKALFEYESPYEGTIVEILANPNSKVPVGAPIAILEVSEAKAKSYSSMGLAQKVDAQLSVMSASNKEAMMPKSEVEDKTKNTIAETGFLVSPYIRHLLHEQGMTVQDLVGLKGSGPQGRLTKEDVEGYISGLPKVMAGSSDFTLEGKRDDLILDDKEKENTLFIDQPISPIRARIAQHLQHSKQTIPHAHTGLEVNLSHILNLRENLKEDFSQKKGFPLRLMPLLFMAIKKSCQSVPLVNSIILEKEGQIRTHKQLNLGMAMGTKNGLLTPVIKHCETSSFIDFAIKYEDLLLKSAQNKLRPTDFEGATFTFNNFGAFGLDFGVQIIPPGQSCVLGMGAIHQKPWVENNEMVIRHIAQFFLAFDHRIMDGREAGEFLSMLKKELETFSFVGLL